MISQMKVLFQLLQSQKTWSTEIKILTKTGLKFKRQPATAEVRIFKIVRLANYDLN